MTITVCLPEKLEAELRARLDAEGIEVSEFVRQAIAEKLEKSGAVPAKPTAFELGKHVFGKRGSGHGDLSENTEAILKERLRADHDRG